MKIPLALIGTTVIGVMAIAIIVTVFQRITTESEIKYFNKSNSELDNVYYYNFTGGTGGTGGTGQAVWGGGGLSGLTGNPAINQGSDWDHDGLDNNTENQLGTNPTDPDTDGDLVADGIEVVLNTNPLDPQSGGVQKILPQPTLPPIIPPVSGGYLQINEFYKNIRNLTNQETKWSHYTAAEYGDTVSFLIYFELTNTSTDQTFTAILIDTLEKNLQYVNHSGQIRINNGSAQPLDDSWILQAYPINISPLLNPQKPVPIEITFNAIVKKENNNNNWLIANNKAELQTNLDIRSDTAWVELIN